MIWTNYNLQCILSLMCKFCNNPPSGSGEEDFLATPTFVNIFPIICPWFRATPFFGGSHESPWAKEALCQNWSKLAKGFLRYGPFSKKFTHTAHRTPHETPWHKLFEQSSEELKIWRVFNSVSSSYVWYVLVVQEISRIFNLLHSGTKITEMNFRSPHFG